MTAPPPSPAAARPRALPRPFPGTPTSRIFIRLLLLLTVLLFGLAAGADRVAAHAALLETTPADGAALAIAPAEATLRYNEPVSVAAVGLVGPDGAPADLTAHVDGAHVTVPLPTLPPGGYALTVRVVSEDGHPIASTVVFTIGPPVGAPPPVATSADDPARAGAVWLVRFALAAGLLIGVAAAAVATLADAAAPPAAALIRRLPWLGALAAGATVVLTGADALGLPLSALAGPDIIRALAAGADTTAFPAAILTLVAATAVLLALHGPLPLRHPLAVAALLATAATFAASGHAATAEPRWLSRGTVALHAGLAALWLGALPALHRSLGAATLPPAGHRILAAFAVGGPIGVGALATAGLTLAVLQGAVTVDVLRGTAYGQILVAKLAVVAALLGLAAVNRWRFSWGAAHDPAARASLRRLVALEITLAILLLAVLSGWRLTPPPRALAAAPVTAPLAEPAAATPAAAPPAVVTVAPGRAGLVTLTLTLPAGPEAAPPLEVAVILAQPDAGIAAIRRPSLRDGDRWRVTGLVLPAAGRWTVEVRVLVTAFHERRLTGVFTLR